MVPNAGITGNTSYGSEFLDVRRRSSGEWIKGIRVSYRILHAVASRSLSKIIFFARARSLRPRFRVQGSGFRVEGRRASRSSSKIIFFARARSLWPSDLARALHSNEIK
jgi:hypothetical protein